MISWPKLRRRRGRFIALAVALVIAAAVGLGLELAGGRGVEVEPVRKATASMPDAETAQPMTLAQAFSIGIAQFRRGDAHAAALAFEAAREIDPSSPEVYANLGFAYLELARPEDARDLFLAAIDLDPSRPNSYFGLAEALEQLGDRPAARGAMTTFVHLTPESDPFRRRALSALWEWSDRPEDETAADPAAQSPDQRTGSLSLYSSALETLDGTPTNLAEFEGRWLVLNIWASWCGPCRAELPSLQRLSEQADVTGMTVIGVSMDKRREFTREFLSELGVSFTNLWDGQGEMTDTLLSVRALPLTLVVAPGGEVALRHEGALDWAAPEVVATLNSLKTGASDTAARAPSPSESVQ